MASGFFAWRNHKQICIFSIICILSAGLKQRKQSQNNANFAEKARAQLFENDRQIPVTMCNIHDFTCGLTKNSERVKFARRSRVLDNKIKQWYN